mgnify:CR=1 FL=1
MVQYSDNEIQVLGSTSKRSSKKWMWLLPLLVVGITWALLVTLGNEETVDIKHFKTELKAPPPRQPEPEMTSGVEYETQVVNDVWLNVYKILDMHAELSLDVSAYTDPVTSAQTETGKWIYGFHRMYHLTGCRYTEG